LRVKNLSLLCGALVFIHSFQLSVGRLADLHKPWDYLDHSGIFSDLKSDLGRKRSRIRSWQAKPNPKPMGVNPRFHNHQLIGVLAYSVEPNPARRCIDAIIEMHWLSEATALEDQALRQHARRRSQSAKKLIEEATETAAFVSSSS
jgi:hypothetical protein